MESGKVLVITELGSDRVIGVVLIRDNDSLTMAHLESAIASEYDSDVNILRHSPSRSRVISRGFDKLYFGEQETIDFAMNGMTCSVNIQKETIQ